MIQELSMIDGGGQRDGAGVPVPGETALAGQVVMEGLPGATPVYGTISGAGNTTVVVAQGSGTQIVVDAFTVQNTDGTAGTILFKKGTAGVAIWPVYADGAADGEAMRCRLEFGDNTALVLNASGGDWVYGIIYHTEAIS